MNASRLLLAAGLAIALSPSAPCAERKLTIETRGYVDAGIVLPDETRSWVDGGVGKDRYGAGGAGERRLKPVLSEAAIIGDLALGLAWRGHLHVKYDDQARHALDIGEAYLGYRSPPHPALRWRFRVGTFLPPVSLENHGIGWTSPYTLASSALNAWIGEEIRVNGGEMKLILDRGPFQLDVFGSVYFANDPAGKLLASRGFAVHDRELGLFDRAPLPVVHALLKNRRGPFRAQANYYEPLHEIDGRIGYYVGANMHNSALGRFSVMYYDNNGDPEALNRTEGHYAWDTRFGVIGYRGEFGQGFTFVTQAMYGETLMGPRLAWTGKRVSETTFFTAYGLLSRELGRFRVSLRGEYFETWDRDRMLGTYDGSENGYGLTLGGAFKPRPDTKLSVELRYLDHARPVRVFAGEPHRIDELGLRFSYRFFF